MKGEWIAAPKNKTAVVYVHGVLSDGVNCWTNSNGAYWPELLHLNKELQGLGIYVYTYETGILSGSYSISNVTEDLWERMKLDDLLKCQRLIFVCHSMGGIVARRLLVTRAVDWIDKKLDIGLFLVASPSLGSDYANWLSPITRFMGHSQATSLRFTQANDWLNDLDTDFMNLARGGKLKIVGRELIEDKFITLRWWFVFKQVVEPFSGNRYFGDKLKVALSDHFSIAKPDGENAIQHRVLCAFIKEMLPLPIDLTGLWKLSDDSNNYKSTLTQTGGTVTGEYRLNSGQIGNVKGFIEGETLKLDWTQAFNKRGGHATLQISADRQKMEGRWTYDPNLCANRETGNGAWVFVRVPGAPGADANARSPLEQIERYATKALSGTRGPASVVSRFRVIAFDLDGTLVRGLDYSWKAVFQFLKYEPAIRRAGMQRFLHGDIDYPQWCDWCVEQFRTKGLKRADFAVIAASLQVTKNLRETIDILRKNGFIVAIISGGIDALLFEKIPDADELFDYICINHLRFDDQNVVNGVEPTPFDFQGKATALEAICTKHGVTLREAIFVGEGFNDAQVINRAGFSIAYPPKEASIRESASVSIEEDDLTQIVKYIFEK